MGRALRRSALTVCRFSGALCRGCGWRAAGFIPFIAHGLTRCGIRFERVCAKSVAPSRTPHLGLNGRRPIGCDVSRVRSGQTAPRSEIRVLCESCRSDLWSRRAVRVPGTGSRDGSNRGRTHGSRHSHQPDPQPHPQGRGGRDGAPGQGWRLLNTEY